MKTHRISLFVAALLGLATAVAQPTPTTSNGPVQKVVTAGATQNDLTGPVNVTGNSTVTVKAGGTVANGGTVNGNGIFDFSLGTVTFAAGQIPNAALANASITISTHPVALGGSLSLAAGDVSGLAASATIDTTSAGNITTGTLPAGRLPAPTAVTLGGVNSKATALHQFVTGIGTDGSVSQAQPAAADISGLAASATVDTTSADNITTGTLPNARLVAVPNTALANSTITISTHAVALGGSLSLAAGDVSGLAPSATTDTTNAGNITAGTLPVARLAAVPNTALANSTITIGSTAIPLGGTVTTLTGLSDPTQSDNPATKGYVDALLYGLDWKPSVRLATTANVALSGLSAIDGVVPVAGDRLLVRAQSTAAQNGIYVAAAGAWSRAADAVDPDVTAGMTVFVNEGSTYGQCAFSLITADPITVGTTSLTFAQVSGPNLYTAGVGINLVGNQISVANVPNTSLANSTVTISGHSLALGGSLNLVPTDVGAEPAITAGTTAQYWRGDKTWQTLDQAVVAGLTTADSPTFAGVTVNGNLTVNGTNTARDIRATGNIQSYASGAGFEAGYDGIQTVINSYDRAATTFKPMLLQASSFTFGADSTQSAVFAGNLTVSGSTTTLGANSSLTTSSGYMVIKSATSLYLDTPTAGDHLYGRINGTIVTDTSSTGLSVAGNLTVSGTGTSSFAGPVSLAGKLTGVASTTSAASLNLPHGTAPTSPANGDIWTTTAGMYVRVNGTTVGPLGAGGGSSGVLAIPILTGGGTTTTWSSMPAAVTFFPSASGYAGQKYVPLTGYTQVRLVVNKRSVAGAVGSKLILKYYTAYSSTVTDFLDIGTSEVSVAIDSGNGMLDSGWINLAAGAKIDTASVVLTGSGGDGATSPNFGEIIAYFK